MSAAPPPSTDAPAPLVFISYSREDKKWKDRLLKYLAPAKSRLKVDVWDDSRLMAGQEWREEINNAIGRARVAVLLVSPQYLDSEWLTNVEVPALLERFGDGGLGIFPLLLEPCAWKSVPWLSRLQLFPTDARPINGRARSTQDSLFTEAAEQIIGLAAGPYESSPKPKAPADWMAAPRPFKPADPSEQHRPDADAAPAAPDEVVSRQDAGRPTVADLDGLQLAGETKEILRLARMLALYADDDPLRVTSSCLLFAIAEAGDDQYDLPRYSIPIFFRHALSINEVDYNKSLALKFPRELPSPRRFDPDWAKTRLLSENVPRIFNLASEISRRTFNPPPADAPSRSSDEPQVAGQIGLRHLLAALLTFKHERRPTGAESRLRAIRPDVDALRGSFYEFIVSRWPADNAETWRAILLLPGLSEPGGAEEVEEERQGEDARGEARAALAGFLTDSWEGDDLLGITPDVNALASLVAAWSVEPPLSIGLFGDWGSGKSHFMRQMRARVEKLSRRARQSPLPQNRVGYYKRIVQIEFNAWHYIEGNLWASLVEHIFEHLKLSDKEDTSLAEKRRRALMNELGITREIQAKAEQHRRELEARAKAARHRAEEAKSARSEMTKDLALLREELKTSVLAQFQLPVEFSGTQKELLSELGIPETSLTTAAGVHEQYLAAQGLWGRARAYLTLFRNDPRRIRRLAVALAVLLIPPAVALALPAAYEALRSERLYRIGAFLGYVLTLTLTFWKNARPYWQQFRKGLAVLERKEQEIDAERRKRVSELEHDVSELTKQYLDAEREAEGIKEEVKRLEEEIAGTDSGRILADFIEDRAACNDYRRHLGVLALIRRDFEKLADLFRQQRQEELSGRSRPGDHTINRIILYIDDLDRCPPDRVVQVLQAIHLLLAFPLFVVVVGVDARWVTRSLQESYEWLRADADGDGAGAPAAPGEPRAATPHDYLEKIFQIPFWLNPLEDAACKEFLDGLTRDSLEGAGRNGDSHGPPAEGDAHVGVSANAFTTTPSAESPGPRAAVAQGAADSGEAEGGGEPAAEADAPQNVSEGAANGGQAGPGGGEGEAGDEAADAEGDDGEEIDLEPQSLKLTGPEVGYMKELTPLVGRSPRAVKRFLNCYRLIRVGLRPEQLQRFVEGDGRGGEFRAVMILLAVITGAPSVSVHVIEELEERRLGARDGTLQDFLEALARKPEVGPRPEWERVRRFLEGHAAQQASADVLRSLLNVVPRVARYSFRVAKFEPAPAPRGGRREGAGVEAAPPRGPGGGA